MDPAVIEQEALRLPDTLRALLADRLIQSLTPVSPRLGEMWIQEADERMRAYRKGELEAVDGPAALADLRVITQRG